MVLVCSDSIPWPQHHPKSVLTPSPPPSPPSAHSRLQESHQTGATQRWFKVSGHVSCIHFSARGGSWKNNESHRIKYFSTKVTKRALYGAHYMTAVAAAVAAPLPAAAWRPAAVAAPTVDELSQVCYLHALKEQLTPRCVSVGEQHNVPHI